MEPWLAYAPVKNNPEDAAKVPKGNPYHSATSGEIFVYRANSLILRKIGVQVGDPEQQVINGQEVEVWPRITSKPNGPSLLQRSLSTICPWMGLLLLTQLMMQRHVEIGKF